MLQMQGVVSWYLSSESSPRTALDSRPSGTALTVNRNCFRNSCTYLDLPVDLHQSSFSVVGFCSVSII